MGVDEDEKGEESVESENDVEGERYDQGVLNDTIGVAELCVYRRVVLYWVSVSQLICNGVLSHRLWRSQHRPVVSQEYCWQRPTDI